MLKTTDQLAGYDVALERLLEIFTSTSVHMDDQIQAVLVNCAEYLDMPAGRVGEIVGEDYLFHACLGAPTTQKPEGRKPLNEVLGFPFTQLTVPIAYPSLADSPFADHPIVLEMGFQCLIVAPLRIDGRVIGALTFAGFETREPLIGHRKITLVRLAANWISMQVDIRQKTEKRIQTDERIRVQFRSAPVMMLNISRQGYLTDASDKWLEMMGYERPEVIGKFYAGFVTRENQRDITDRAMPALWEKGLALQNQRKFVSKSGSTLDCECSSIARKNEFGEYDSALTIIVDVSERNRAQAELAAKNHELELTNEQLRQFAYIASHDLQEPLRKICMFGDTLASELGDDLSKEARYSLDTMVSAAARLSGLVSDVLSLSQAAYSEISLEEIDLEELITQVIEDLERIIKEKSAHITVTGLPLVFGDRRQLTRLFSNIIGNSLKYHPANSPPVVEVFVNKGGKSGEENGISGTEIFIKDSGIGFEDACSMKIFQAFHRLNPRGEYGGSGIGLAIVKTIADRHNWVVSAESKKEIGAVFHISIPPSSICLEKGGEFEHEPDAA